MIGKLKGAIDSYGEDFVILDVHGVGYLVHCSARTLQALPAAGEAVEPAIERLSGALDERTAPQPVRDAVSALVNLGYGQPQAAAAIAAASREAGDGADTARLIRLGLKEVAK